MYGTGPGFVDRSRQSDCTSYCVPRHNRKGSGPGKEFRSKCELGGGDTKAKSEEELTEEGK